MRESMDEEKVDKSDRKGAAVKFPPPVIFLISMALAFGLHTVFPINMGLPIVAQYLGGLIILSALVLVFYISQIFSRLKTSIEPWKPTTAIISTGIYAYSRNPIYVAFCLVPVGLGLIMNSVWLLLSFLPAAFLVYVIAIKKEEFYLEEKFGEEYLAYKARVRRWL